MANRFLNDVEINGNVGIGTTSPVQHISTTERVLHVANSNVASLNLDSTGPNGDCYVLSSRNNGDFRIYNDDTNATPLVINSSGNVGIGTTSPTRELDVEGGITSSTNGNRVKGNINLGLQTDSITKYTSLVSNQYLSTTESEGYSLVTGISTSTYNRTSIGGGLNEQNAATEIRFYTADNTTTRAGTSRMTIGATGNVGIGTDSPSAKFQVKTLGTSGIPISTAETGTLSIGSSSSTATAALLGRQTSATTGLWIGAATNNTNVAGDMHFDVRENNNSTFSTLTNAAFVFSHFTTKLLTVLRNGNVGIGTTSPAEKLSVSGNAIFTNNVTVGGNLIVNGTTTTLNTQTVEVEDNILQLNTTQGTPDTATAATSGISVYRGDGVTQASLVFDEADDTWDLTNSLAVAGNVGIGTTSPAAKLHVASNGRIVKIASATASGYAEAGYENDAGDTLVIGSIGSTYSNSAYAGMRYIYATAGDLALKANASTGNVRIFAGGSALADERMRITSTGAISFGSTGTAYGTSGQLLTSNGNGSPTWQDAPASGPDTVTVTGSTGSRTTTIVEGLNLAGVENLGMPTTGGYTVMGISNGSGSVAAGTVVSFHDSDTTENDDPFAVDLRSNGDYFWNMHGKLYIEQTNQNRGGDLQVQNDISWGADLAGANASGQQLIGMSNGDSISASHVHIGASGKVHLHGSSGGYNLEIHQTGAAAIELNAFTGELQVAGAGITPGTDASPNALGVGTDGRLQTVNVGYTPLAVTKNGSNQFPVVFANAENFSLSCAGAWTITPTIASGDIGKTGTIIITNTATTTPGSLPSTFKTPNGDSIVFQTDSGDVSILSYLVVSTSIVLVNYVGNFS